MAASVHAHLTAASNGHIAATHILHADSVCQNAYHLTESYLGLVYFWTLLAVPAYALAWPTGKAEDPLTRMVGLASTTAVRRPK